MATLAPASARLSAMARPSRMAAPVTSATRPSNLRSPAATPRPFPKGAPLRRPLKSLLYPSPSAMPSYRELLSRARAETPEISVESLRTLLASAPGVTLLDVRDADESAEGHIPGALLLPRAWLELRVEALVPRDAPLVVYCQSGDRSALAARSLAALGYTNVRNL